MQQASVHVNYHDCDSKHKDRDRLIYHSSVHKSIIVFQKQNCDSFMQVRLVRTCMIILLWKQNHDSFMHQALLH